MCSSITKAFVFILSTFAVHVFAQESSQSVDKKLEASVAATKNTTTDNTASVKNTDAKTEITKAQPAKKMVQDATINLQTTITGNQEQPRVLYILPWQSPLTTNVDFEPLDSQQKAAFSHVEREELRRELESAGEL
jgi:hypothetical protein